MKKKLLILGAGGCGREVAEIAYACQKANTVDWELEGFLDDTPELLRTGICNGISVKGSIREWEPKEDEVFIVALGTPEHRETLANLFEQRGANFTNVIHPTAVIAPSAQYETGLILGQFAVISVNTNIGKHVLINMHNAVGHDASIGDYSVISAFCDITGYVKVGKKVLLGSHVAIAPKLKIGDDALVGIGSVVVTPIKAGKHVFGNPASSLSL